MPPASLLPLAANENSMCVLRRHAVCDGATEADHRRDFSARRLRRTARHAQIYLQIRLFLLDADPSGMFPSSDVTEGTRMQGQQMTQLAQNTGGLVIALHDAVTSLLSDPAVAREDVAGLYSLIRNVYRLNVEVMLRPGKASQLTYRSSTTLGRNRRTSILFIRVICRPTSATR